MWQQGGKQCEILSELSLFTLEKKHKKLLLSSDRKCVRHFTLGVAVSWDKPGSRSSFRAIQVEEKSRGQETELIKKIFYPPQTQHDSTLSGEPYNFFNFLQMEMYDFR